MLLAFFAFAFACEKMLETMLIIPPAVIFPPVTDATLCALSLA